MRPAPLLLLALLAPLGAGCKTDAYAERTPIPHVTVDPEPAATAPGAAEAMGAYLGVPAGDATVGEALGRFALDLAVRTGAETRVGALPVVTYDARRAPWVSELGVRIADEVATRLRGAGARGQVLAPAEMAARLRMVGVDKADLASLEALVDHGAALRLDVVTFGTLKSEHAVATATRDVLTLELNALDLATGRVLARERFEVASDRPENRPFFALAARESLWNLD